MNNQTVYKTKQRTIIKESIKALGEKHFTVDALCDTLSKNGQSVGRTTVYRCVEKLCDDGVLRKYASVAGNSACYQYVEDGHCHEHFHLKCEKCGNLLHLECEELNSIGDHIKEHHSFNINPLKTVFYGVCESCAEK